MVSHQPGQRDPGRRKGKAKGEAPSLLDMIMRQPRASSLDDIAEPTMEELAALDAGELLDDLPADIPLDMPLDEAPPLSLLAEMQEPELLSLESLDDAEDSAALDDFDDADGELRDDADSLSYLDIDLDDDELDDDDGYDMDEDEVESYQDLYGADDAIIPSFREGEFAEDEDGDTDYYNELR